MSPPTFTNAGILVGQSEQVSVFVASRNGEVVRWIRDE
jgi:hypothetical protein